jgi:hypothetical protein
MSSTPLFGATSGFSFSNLKEEPVDEPYRRPRQAEEATEAHNGPLPSHFPEEPTDYTPEEEAPHLRPHTQRRRYAPRTCRICLEKVLPTFEIPEDGFAATFNPTPKVTYVSEDPADGRLISPCKCKGSSRYVHEGCLQAWRHANKDYAQRNYWECPTCGFKYHLTRLTWSLWISSTAMQLFLTVCVMFAAIFLLGFVADPIINLYFDPYGTITSSFTSSPSGQNLDSDFMDDENSTWAVHFAKGLASLGLLGFVKAFFAMSPWQWWNLRTSGVIGGNRRRGDTGRERLENISWGLVLIGVATFLYVRQP